MSGSEKSPACAEGISIRERLVVVFSFILIFAFNSIDNAIAPLVRPIAQFFQVTDGQALLLISVCTGGTVVGLILGPAMLTMVKTRQLLLWVLAVLAGAQALFALAPCFGLAIFFRFMAGLAAGFVATIMWQLTFHGVSKASFPAMIAVLMSARPLATAIGVPVAGLIAWEASWQLPCWLIAFLTALSGALLYWFYPVGYAANAIAEVEEQEAEAKSAVAARRSLWQGIKSVVKPFFSALSVPYAYSYYIGSTINRMAYFGFYSFCGIWFFQHYELNIKSISFALLVIGLTEALVNFSTGKIIEKCGHKATFLTSLCLSGILLPCFIFGQLPLSVAIGVIAVFMLLDRVYSMALVISVPQMFPSTGDKTAFGSLNTLTAWGAMTIVSGCQGQLLRPLGITFLEWMIVVCFLIGSAALCYVQHRTIFSRS